jgi:hypothetical protein
VGFPIGGFGKTLPGWDGESMDLRVAWKIGPCLLTYLGNWRNVHS